MRGVSVSLRRFVFSTKAQVERVVYQCSGCGKQSKFGLDGVKFCVRTDKLWDPPGGAMLWLIVGAIIFGVVIVMAW